MKFSLSQRARGLRPNKNSSSKRSFFGLRRNNVVEDREDGNETLNTEFVRGLTEDVRIMAAPSSQSSQSSQSSPPSPPSVISTSSNGQTSFITECVFPAKERDGCNALHTIEEGQSCNALNPMLVGVDGINEYITSMIFPSAKSEKPRRLPDVAEEEVEYRGEGCEKDDATREARDKYIIDPKEDAGDDRGVMNMGSIDMAEC